MDAPPHVHERKGEEAKQGPTELTCEPCEAQDEGVRTSLKCPLLVSVLTEDQSNDLFVVAARNPK